MNENYGDKRLEIIRGLILEEEAVGEPVVFKVTVLQSIIDYEKTAFDSTEQFQNTLIAELGKMRPFSPRHRSQLNEGFLSFSRKDNGIDCYYVREMPFRWDYVNVHGRSIQSLKVKRVDPSYRVRISILFEGNKATMTFFGGTETLVFHAREIVCDAVKKFIYNFAKRDIHFSPVEMQNILAKFGRYVELVNIDPRDNEKFSKIVETKISGKAEVKKVIIYDVFNVRMTGIRITISPEVARLIKEEGIRLTEISGGLWLELGIRITTRVKSNGRVEFIIPSKYFGSEDERIYETAVKLYNKQVPIGIEPEKGPLERFIQ